MRPFANVERGSRKVEVQNVERLARRRGSVGAVKAFANGERGSRNAEVQKGERFARGPGGVGAVRAVKDIKDGGAVAFSGQRSASRPAMERWDGAVGTLSASYVIFILPVSLDPAYSRELPDCPGVFLKKIWMGERGRFFESLK